VDVCVNKTGRLGSINTEFRRNLRLESRGEGRQHEIFMSIRQKRTSGITTRRIDPPVVLATVFESSHHRACVRNDISYCEMLSDGEEMFPAGVGGSKRKRRESKSINKVDKRSLDYKQSLLLPGQLSQLTPADEEVFENDWEDFGKKNERQSSMAAADVWEQFGGKPYYRADGYMTTRPTYLCFAKYGGVYFPWNGIVKDGGRVKDFMAERRVVDKEKYERSQRSEGMMDKPQEWWYDKSRFCDMCAEDDEEGNFFWMV
jgi:hypothetical protein